MEIKKDIAPAFRERSFRVVTAPYIRSACFIPGSGRGERAKRNARAGCSKPHGIRIRSARSYSYGCCGWAQRQGGRISEIRPG